MRRILSHEVIEMVRRMDMGKVENQLILQCAPLIVGLRISNLCIFPLRHLRPMRALLQGSGIFCYVLYVEGERATVLLYHRGRLAAHLGDAGVREFLEHGFDEYGRRAECGGCCGPEWCGGYGACHEPGLALVLEVFRRRYRKYRRGSAGFPHELGLILGYPIEDVKGFVENGGKNFLYVGYWKVYEDVPAKKEFFHMCELARELSIELVWNGVGIEEMMDVYGAGQMARNSR